MAAEKVVLPERHGAQLKALVLEQCSVRGASVAKVPMIAKGGFPGLHHVVTVPRRTSLLPGRHDGRRRRLNASVRRPPSARGKVRSPGLRPACCDAR